MRLAIAIFALAAAGWAAWDANRAPLSLPQPGPLAMCPVCGMIVSKYPDWTATLVWKDGSADYFDGAKDMFKFLEDLTKYAPKRRREDIRVIAVTDFYNLRKVHAENAFYVIGSDVEGPMGHEFTPLATREDAEEFRADHRGKRILTYAEVTRSIVAKVDAGQFQ